MSDPKANLKIELKTTSWFRSLAVRSVAFTALFLLLAVGLTTYVVLGQFRDYLERRVHEAGVSEARRAAGAVGAILDGYAGVGAVLAGNLAVMDDGQRRDEVLETALSTNREIVAVHAFAQDEEGELVPDVFAFSKKLDSTRLENLSANALAAKVRQGDERILEAARAAATTGPRLASRLEELGVPVVSIVFPYTVRDEDGERWLVMSIWSDRLIATLPLGDMRRGILVTADATPLLAPTRVVPGDVAPGIAQRIRGQGEPFGSASVTGSDQPVVDAFAKVPGYGLAVLVRTDTTEEGRASELIIKRAAVAGWIVLLLVVLASLLTSRRLSKRLRRVSDATRQIASGDFRYRIEDPGRDEVGLVSSAVDQMAGRIETFLVNEVEKARLEREMAMAKEVQTKFFPPPSLESGALSISSITKAASECGGDWWGHFAPDGQFEYVFMGDATGHGAPAALVTAMVYSCCHDLVPEMAAGVSPEDLLRRVGDLFFRAGAGTTTMTLLAIRFDLAKGVATIANGGHVFPVFLPAGEDRLGNPSRTKPRLYTRIMANGNLIGASQDYRFRVVDVELQEGDRLMLMTDGLFEGVNRLGEAYGLQRMRSRLDNLVATKAKDPAAELLADAERFFDGAPLADDVTVATITVKRLAKSGSRAA